MQMWIQITHNVSLLLMIMKMFVKFRLPRINFSAHKIQGCKIQSFLSVSGAYGLTTFQSQNVHLVGHKMIDGLEDLFRRIPTNSFFQSHKFQIFGAGYAPCESCSFGPFHSFNHSTVLFLQSFNYGLSDTWANDEAVQNALHVRKV